MTTPARRAFDTPENAVLVHALSAIREQGRRTGWIGKGTDLGPIIRERVDLAEKWLRVRSLPELQALSITPRLISRVRSGRAARRYEAAIEVALLHQRYLRELDREAIRRAVESHALVVCSDDVLFELLTLFAVERGLQEEGWSTSLPGVINSGGRVLMGRRDGDLIEIFYQRTPPELGGDSRYAAVQRVHDLKPGALRPDLIFRLTSGDGVRWVIVEAKGGQKREVEQSARDALQNLLAYRRAFESVLANQSGPYGLGVAWGEDLLPSDRKEVVLCSPDTIGRALELLFPG